MKKIIRRFLWKYDVIYRLQEFWCRHGGYRLALWVDKRHPEYCWAEVCLKLGMARGLLHWREEADSQSICKKDCEYTGSCWCGKIRNPERMEQFHKELQERLTK